MRPNHDASLDHPFLSPGGGADPFKAQSHHISFSQPQSQLPTSRHQHYHNTQNSQSMDFSQSSPSSFTDFWPSERLTRFYTKSPPPVIMQRLVTSLEQFLVPCQPMGGSRITFATVDKRKCPLSGDIQCQAANDSIWMLCFRRTKVLLFISGDFSSPILSASICTSRSPSPPQSLTTHTHLHATNTKP